MIPEILFEDNHLIVAVKPAGVLSQASDLGLPDMLTLIKTYLKDKHAKPGNVYLGLVHRLDVNVGGVMVFAKTSKAAARLSEAIRTAAFIKTYLAVVEGHIPKDETGEYTDYLVKDHNSSTAKIVGSEKGKLATLKYRALEGTVIHGSECTLVEIELITGRFHQIRIQFASRNMPIANDVKYGATTKFSTETIALWAYKLSFPHPITKEPLTFINRPNNNLFASFTDTINNLQY